MTHEQDSIERPGEGTIWQHKNGNLYQVILIANQPGRPDEYPVTVVYRGENGKVWARPITRWYGSMTFVRNGFDAPNGPVIPKLL